MIGHNEISDAVEAITHHHSELVSLMTQASDRAKSIGQILIDIRPTLKAAGSNITKLCEQLPFNKTTAYEYMSLAEGKTTWSELYERKKSSVNSARAENQPNDNPSNSRDTLPKQAVSSYYDGLRAVDDVLNAIKADNEWKPKSWMDVFANDMTMGALAAVFSKAGLAAAEEENDLKLWRLSNSVINKLASLGGVEPQAILNWAKHVEEQHRAIAALITFLLYEFHPSQDTKALSAIRFGIDIRKLTDEVGGVEPAYVLLEFVLEERARSKGFTLPDSENNDHHGHLRETLLAFKDLAGSFDALWENLIEGYRDPTAQPPFGDGC